MPHDTTASPFLTALAEQRELVARRAAAVLASRELVESEGSTGLHELLGLLAASIEELKVVEEEMLLQHEDFAEARSQVERNASYHQMLFKHTPAALLVTDSAGMIREANTAASALLRRPAEYLVAKPLSAFVPREQRGEFRTALSRMSLTTAVSDWRVELMRPTDAPIHVTMAAQVAPGLYDGMPAIIWTLRPLGGALGAAVMASSSASAGELTAQ